MIKAVKEVIFFTAFLIGNLSGFLFLYRNINILLFLIVEASS